MGHIWGPFVHGVERPLNQLAECWQCADADEPRTLCTNCRDDRLLVMRPGKKRCLTGHCPARERGSHGAEWGTQWMKHPDWMAAYKYDPEGMSQEVLQRHFYKWWPNPLSLVEGLRAAVVEAQVGRDFGAASIPRPYGAGAGSTTIMHEVIMRRK